MCYKGSISKEERKLMGYGNKGKKGIRTIQPSYNVNAFSNPAIPIVAQDSPDYITTATWGLVPFWGKRDPEKFLKDSKYTLNARGEDFWETKSYKPYVQEGRCVILFDGFYEPHTFSSNKKQPFYCYVPNDAGDYNSRSILPIAGIYSIMDDEYYVSLVTTEANDFFAKVHNVKKRMPLVLDDKLVEEWIKPEQSKSVIDDLVRKGFTSKEFHAHAVSNDIYKRDFVRDGKDVIDPVQPIQNIF
ncbi:MULTISPECIES: SOS response-associated peptidase [Christiangramia]|uniref:Abasic site processing protein n=1 Tax=Christiangramia flava JLT2011 TaxID=1229726 RepID=A0A1L7I3E7_9FLAO|nr:SOS response-associated peptidase family protein [Christiangramia flava]APU67665.1 hypothetical protein GRFL_0941 [Christiangramia flava JLT2011]OSS37589.1 hypothetical protein C723_3498 [Christiangramia flava JLT2011]